MYLDTRVNVCIMNQRLFGGGLRRMSSGYLCLRDMSVPDVRRDTACGSISDIIDMDFAHIFGEHLVMHQPSEHCMTRGASAPILSVNASMSALLRSDGETVNAM